MTRNNVLLSQTIYAKLHAGIKSEIRSHIFLKSAIWNLIEWKTGFLPTINTATQHDGITETIVETFFRLTGGTCLPGSGTIKNDLLRFRK